MTFSSFEIDHFWIEIEKNYFNLSKGSEVFDLKARKSKGLPLCQLSTWAPKCHFSPNFNYSKKWEFSIGYNRNFRSTLILTFNITKVIWIGKIEKMQTTYIGLICAGVVFVLFSIILHIFIYKKHLKRKSVKTSILPENPDTNEQVLDLVSLIPDLEVTICKRKFPQDIIKTWSDIEIGHEVGEGNFGKVYKGFWHFSEFQR